MTLGIPAPELTAGELERELKVVHARRHDTFLRGTAHALSTHTRRMFELELEYLSRWPERVREDHEKTAGGGAGADSGRLPRQADGEGPEDRDDRGGRMTSDGGGTPVDPAAKEELTGAAAVLGDAVTPEDLGGADDTAQADAVGTRASGRAPSAADALGPAGEPDQPVSQGP